CYRGRADGGTPRDGHTQDDIAGEESDGNKDAVDPRKIDWRRRIAQQDRDCKALDDSQAAHCHEARRAAARRRRAVTHTRDDTAVWRRRGRTELSRAIFEL